MVVSDCPKNPRGAHDWTIVLTSPALRNRFIYLRCRACGDRYKAVIVR